MIDRGVRCANSPAPPTAASLLPCASGVVEAPNGPNADIDGQTRPSPLTLRITSPWDRGADESPIQP